MVPAGASPVTKGWVVRSVRHAHTYFCTPVEFCTRAESRARVQNFICVKTKHKMDAGAGRLGKNAR